VAVDAMPSGGSGLVPVERSESVMSTVARRLLDYLTSGRVPPGTRLPSERKLAETLQVGRSAIREAIAALDLLGIVDVRPGSGTYLVTTSSDLLPSAINWGFMLGQPRTNDLVEVRQYLEILSARLAAERATAEDLAGLAEGLETLRRSTEDVRSFVEADVAFHLQVASTAKNTVLQDILHSVRALLLAWVQRTSQDTTSAKVSYEEHSRVFDAIRNGDPDAAEEAMRHHMSIASARLRSSLAEPTAVPQDPSQPPVLTVQLP
jgi:DNA-binding FadR family transcriptional regulator